MTKRRRAKLVAMSTLIPQSYGSPLLNLQPESTSTISRELYSSSIQAPKKSANGLSQIWTSSLENSCASASTTSTTSVPTIALFTLSRNSSSIKTAFQMQNKVAPLFEASSRIYGTGYCVVSN